MLENRLVLTGVVREKPQIRFTPAGIPIASFHLQHHSIQQEAGYPRKALCTLPVLFAGESVQERMQQLEAGSRVRVTGFISRANHRHGEYRLVLHGQQIETIAIE